MCLFEVHAYSGIPRATGLGNPSGDFRVIWRGGIFWDCFVEGSWGGCVILFSLGCDG